MDVVTRRQTLPHSATSRTSRKPNRNTALPQPSHKKTDTESDKEDGHPAALYGTGMMRARGGGGGTQKDYYRRLRCTREDKKNWKKSARMYGIYYIYTYRYTYVGHDKALPKIEPDNKKLRTYIWYIAVSKSRPFLAQTVHLFDQSTSETSRHKQLGLFLVSFRHTWQQT